MKLSSKSPYFTAHIKINYETDCFGRFSEKMQIYILRIITTSKMDLVITLVVSFQSLTNFTKNPNIGVMEVLNVPLKFVWVNKLSIEEQ